MVCLLPEMNSVGKSTAKPRWRDWASGASEEGTWADLHRMTTEIVGRLLEDVGSDGHQWSDLIAHIDDLPAGEFAMVVERLQAIDPSRLPREEKKLVWDSLRSKISRHVAFPDAKWVMPQEQLSQLQDAYARFAPSEFQERYAWLFSDNPDVITPRDDWEERIRLMNDMRMEAVRDMYTEGSVQALLDFAAQTKQPGNVGYAIGLSGVLAEGEDVFLWQHLGSDAEVRRPVALGYLSARAFQAGIGWLEMQASSKFARYAVPQQLADFYRVWPFTNATWDRLDTLDEETRRLYWGQVTFWGLGEADAVDHERAVANWVNYGHFGMAIDFISLYAKGNEARVSPTTVADLLDKATHQDAIVNWSNLDYGITKLLDILEAWEGMDSTKLASIEWFFLPVLQHYRPPRTLYRALAAQPELFCEVLKWVYRASGEEPKALTAQEQARAHFAHDLLQGWHSLPGQQADGSIDDAVLKAWVTRARELVSESGRGTIGDQEIGRVLSTAPKGTDAVWPHEAVRDVLDDLMNEDVDTGLALGVYNGRGVTTRAMGEGGDQERVLVDQYRGYARHVRERWSRTASVLERIATMFERDARREDTKADLEQDLWR